MKTLLVILLTFVTCAAQTRQRVEDKIAKLAGEYGGTIGMYAKNFKTGETLSVNSDSLFPTASVIKVPILVTLFHKFEDGSLDRNATVTLTDSNKWGGSGVLQFFYVPQQLKLMNAAVLMITLSDNTATNMVIDSFANLSEGSFGHDDKLLAVNSLMDSLGLHHTRLLNKMMSFKTKKNTPESIRFGVGFSSPREMGTLLEMIAEHKILTPSDCDEIIKILSDQQDESMAPRYLPIDSTADGETFIMAHKTGSVDASKVDVGIVYSPEANYVFAVFTDQSKFQGESLNNPTILAVAKASRIVYDYFTKK